MLIVTGSVTARADTFEALLEVALAHVARPHDLGAERLNPTNIGGGRRANAYSSDRFKDRRVKDPRFCGHLS